MTIYSINLINIWSLGKLENWKKFYLLSVAVIFQHSLAHSGLLSPVHTKLQQLAQVINVKMLEKQLKSSM